MKYTGVAGIDGEDPALILGDLHALGGVLDIVDGAKTIVAAIAIVIMGGHGDRAGDDDGANAVPLELIGQTACQDAAPGEALNHRGIPFFMQMNCHSFLPLFPFRGKHWADYPSHLRKAAASESSAFSGM